MNAAVPVLGGVCVSLGVRLRRARRDRVIALARERAAMVREARADERRRLAVEMHDALGHVLTLLVLHANTLVVSAPDAGTRTVGERMSRLGGDALGELRQLLDLLKDPTRRPSERAVFRPATPRTVLRRHRWAPRWRRWSGTRETRARSSTSPGRGTTRACRRRSPARCTASCRRG